MNKHGEYTVTCATCDGTGAIETDYPDDDLLTCSDCDGTGEVHEYNKYF